MRQTRAQGRTVYLVGAGPGDPELLTVRALRLLQTADVVLHDDLVPAEVLALAGSNAEVTSVGKRCGRARITQAEIGELMVAAARAGRAVVRLKSGDPLVFGRAGEEIFALREAGVEFEVVPGVTAALGAGAALGLPLTDRERASKLVFVTGHHATEKGPEKLVWDGQLPDDATVVVYMPGRNLAGLAGELMAAGLGIQTPCAAVSHAATPRQSFVACTLGQLGAVAAGPAPLILLVGMAVEGLLGGSRTGD